MVNGYIGIKTISKKYVYHVNLIFYGAFREKNAAFVG